MSGKRSNWSISAALGRNTNSSRPMLAMSSIAPLTASVDEIALAPSGRPRTPEKSRNGVCKRPPCRRRRAPRRRMPRWPTGVCPAGPLLSRRQLRAGIAPKWRMRCPRSIKPSPHLPTRRTAWGMPPPMSISGPTGCAGDVGWKAYSDLHADLHEV